MIVFIAFLFFMTILKFINTLLISAIAYLVIGVIIFCYMLIDELAALHISTDSRPIDYFKYKIGSVIIILNVLSGILRISGSIIIMLFITILKIEKKRSKNLKYNIKLIFRPGREGRKFYKNWRCCEYPPKRSLRIDCV